MGSARRQQRELFDKPAVYRIQVIGRLADEVIVRLLNQGLAAVPADGEAPASILEGKLRDQAALAGVLDLLYELHLPIISVELLAGRPAPADE